MSAIDVAPAQSSRDAGGGSSYHMLPSHVREQDQIDWVRSARSYPGREWSTYDARPFPLIVIAEDVVAPGKGFGLHGHHDMEVISYVLSGALEHVDSSGNREVLHQGEIQLMTSGRGIRHSEFNASQTEPVHFLQIWVTPDRAGLAPSYNHALFDLDAPLSLLAAPIGGLVRIHQDLAIWRAAPTNGPLDVPLSAGARAWAHVVRGPVIVAEAQMNDGDGLAFTGLAHLSISSDKRDAEVLIFVETAPAAGS